MLRKFSSLFFCASLLALAACSDDTGNGPGDDQPDATPPPPAMLTVVAPNGGEMYAQDAIVEITWTSMDLVGAVNIELYRGGAYDSDIVLDEPDNGTYSWTVPAAQANGGDYRVRVSSADEPAVFDESDADFVIDARSIAVTAPNGGEEVIAGNLLPITWTSTGTIPLVDIEVHRAGMPDSIIVEGVDNNGAFDWPIETDRVHAADYTIMIRDPDGPAMDVSDAPFTVRNWTTRSPLAITTTVPQANYPVAIELDAGNFNYALAEADGSDLRFATTTDRAAGFDLPYYIETWDPTGTSIIWVNVPTLDLAGPTMIYMFYGLSGLASTSDMAATFPNSFVSSGADVLNGDYVYDMFTVAAGHTVTLTPGVSSTIAARLINVEGTIDGTGAGYAGGGNGQAGTGPGGGGTSTNSGAGGGGYGGPGGSGGLDPGDTPGAGGAAYGDPTLPIIDMGSGGGGSTDGLGGNGGGAVALVARRIAVSGSITMDGGAGDGATGSLRSTGGGAGGGILVFGYDLSLTGLFSARGGAGGANGDVNADDGGGGGGGRVKFFSERNVDDMSTVDVAPGAGGPSGSGGAGQNGTAGVPSADPMATTAEPDYALMPEEPVFTP